MLLLPFVFIQYLKKTKRDDAEVRDNTESFCDFTKVRETRFYSDRKLQPCSMHFFDVLQFT